MVLKSYGTSEVNGGMGGGVPESPGTLRGLGSEVNLNTEEGHC